MIETGNGKPGIDNMTMEWTEVPELIRRGLHGDAMTMLRRCLEAGIGDPGELRYWAGWCHEVDPGGDKEAAVGYYRQAAALRRDPAGRSRCHYRAGWLLMQARRWDEAARAFEAAAFEAGHADPPADEQWDARYWHAGCLEASGRYLDALVGYRSCASSFPRIAPEARFREVVCLVHVGRFTEALAACNGLQDVPPEGFDPERYRELRVAVARERDLLVRCLREGAPPFRAGATA